MAEFPAQRIAERLALSLPVEFRGTQGVVEARTVNVSRGGMFIETNATLPEGSRAFFRFRNVSNQMQFHLEGEVVWSRKKRGPKRAGNPNGMGVRFIQQRAQSDLTLENIFSVLHHLSS